MNILPPTGSFRLFRTVEIVLSYFLIFSLLCPWSAVAAPTGGQVVSGSATISQSGTTTNINQSTNTAIINWLGFSIGSTETVNFYQPSSSAMTLNRVIGNEKSIISGALNANGKVYIVNANGILFNSSASVNTGGLVASTLGITDANFNAGNFVFQGNGQMGQVINLGVIKATGSGSTGGYVALLGDQAINEGVIIADKGTVSLNGAQKVTLNFNGDSLVSVTLDEGSLNALVESKNAIIADGGKVILTAKAANELVASQVNVSGIVQARTLADLTGGIEVYAHGGTANVSGTLDASAPNGGNGGTIETSGSTVKIADSAVITTYAPYGKTGTWLLDPVDFTIAASGGDITGAALGNLLRTNNVTILSSQGASGTNGDINVNDSVTWADYLLTLNAFRNININGVLSPSGASGGLSLIAGNDIFFNSALALGASSLTATAGGKINLAAPLSWTGGQTVALTAANNLNLYGTITGNGGTLNLTSTGGDILFDGITSLGATTLNAVATAGNVNLNAALTWTGDTTATLTAGQAININAPLTATGTNAHLAMNYGTDYNILTKASYAGPVLNADGTAVAQIAPVGAVYGSVTLSGANSALTMNGQSYTLLRSLADFNNLSSLVSGGHYALANDIDFSGTDFTSFSKTGYFGGRTSLSYTYGGLLIGYLSDATLAGLGHSLNNITVGSASSPVAIAKAYNGIIGIIGGTSVVRDLGIDNLNIHATSYYTSNTVRTPTISYIGGLAGYALGTATASPTIKYVYTDGQMTTTQGAGYGISNAGLVGFALYTAFDHDAANVDIHSYGNASGFANTLMYGTLSNSDATGDVTSAGGGAFGFASSVTDTGVSYVYATGDATSPSTSSSGAGLFGEYDTYSKTGSVKYSFATGKVYGGYNLGGLIGTVRTSNGYALNLDHVYATGDVTGYTASGTDAGIGGLIGYAYLQSGNLNVSNAFAKGNVSLVLASTDTHSSYFTGVGGLIGFQETYSSSHSALNLSNSFASGDVTAAQSWYVGGLAGWLSSANISNSYAAGDVVGYNNAGGLVGSFYTGTISNVYSTGSVTGLKDATALGTANGAFIGAGTDITATGNNYYSLDVSGSASTNSLGNAAYSSLGGTGSVTGLSNTQGLGGTVPNTSAITGSNPGQEAAATAASATSSAAATASSAISAVNQRVQAAQQSTMTQATQAASGQQASAVETPAAVAQAVATPSQQVSLADAIRDFGSLGGSGGGGSFRAGVKTISADGVTYTVEEDGPTGAAGAGSGNSAPLNQNAQPAQ
ncbi:beta strand repeat-containing protein [Humidesulfovibrio idahonensis]